MFRNTQKNLIVASDSSLHLYDLSRQKLSKSFSLKARVSALAVNYCDAYIAAGCEDGSVQLATVASNQVYFIYLLSSPCPQPPSPSPSNSK